MLKHNTIIVLARNITKYWYLLKLSPERKFKADSNDLPDSEQKDMDQIEFGICSFSQYLCCDIAFEVFTGQEKQQ